MPLRDLSGLPKPEHCVRAISPSDPAVVYEVMDRYETCYLNRPLTDDRNMCIRSQSLRTATHVFSRVPMSHTSEFGFAFRKRVHWQWECGVRNFIRCWCASGMRRQRGELNIEWGVMTMEWQEPRQSHGLVTSTVPAPM